MLRVHEVVKRYPGGVQALRGINLEIPAGLFGLLGPNGAGKSTLMRIIATLQVPDEGSVELGGVDAERDPQAIRQRLGYLPQDFGVYPRVSAQALLGHIAELKGIVDRRARAEEVEWALAQANLTEVGKRPVATFSGGMRQRFGIAQALLGRPELVIVDEPTAGLDPEERNRFHNLLAEIGKEVVVILSTHIVDDVADLCPKMAILSEGRLLAQGNPRALVGELRGRVWSIEVEPGEEHAIEGDRDVIARHWREGRRVVHVLADERPGEGYEAIEPRLEDFYFATLRSGGRPAQKGQGDAAADSAL